MLQFPLFGFPIRIHWLFWLNSALLGGAFGARTPTQFQGVLVWIGMVFLSILIHELGHAFAMRRFGDRRVEIVLYAFGGLAIGSSWRSRTEQILVSAAGPAAQIAVGFLVWFLTSSLRVDSLLVKYALGSFVFVSIFWGALNLLPIIPMDGGRISEAMFGPSKERLALTLSFICAVAIAAYMGLLLGQLFAALFFGMLAYNNFQRLNQRPQVPWMNVR
jgi:stage IV sporulation protein FB